VPSAVKDRLWHIPFNRVDTLPEQLVEGREAVFFGDEFAVQGGTLPDDVVDYHVRMLSRPGALRGSVGRYRALDATLAQNEQRKATALRMPVLAIGGEASYGVGKAMELVAVARRADPARGRPVIGHAGGMFWLTRNRFSGS
jgi:hypothetical protein